MRSWMRLSILFVVLACLPLHAACAEPVATDIEAAWRALAAGGHLAIIRHARAPGIGDPPGFRLDDCGTQRNLSAEGRAEAVAIGRAFAARLVRVEAIYSSEWCRCLETARLFGLGPVTPLSLLNSFFTRPDLEGAQLARLRPWVATRKPEGTAILVTHQVVVTALTGIVPASGEIVVARPEGGDRLAVVGRIPPP